jgi:imidazolonepropionase-like amidohydrolase
MRNAPLLASLFGLLCSLACSHAPPALLRGEEVAPPLTVFADVALFSGADAQPPVAHQDVWVRGAQIEYVGATGSRAVPAEAVIVKGEGLTLMPGLIDVHVHSTGITSPPWSLHLPDPNRNLESYLYAGITTAADVGGKPEDVASIRADLQQGKRLGPHLLIAGAPFTAHDGHPLALIRAVLPWPLRIVAGDGFAVEVGTPAEVDHAMDELLPLHPDLIKLVSDQLPIGAPTIAPDVAKHVVERAHKAGLMAVAHIGGNDDVTKMLDAGIDLLVHGVYREKLSDEVAERIAKAGVAVAPTLAVFDHIDRLQQGDLVVSPLAQQVADPEVLEATEHVPKDYEISDAFRKWFEAVHACRQTKFENVATMRKHGVVILAGSDSANVGHFPGAGLHDELELLVQAGLTPAEALHAATEVNAHALKLDEHIGTVAPGKRADLLLVRGDPTADIHALNEIEAVYIEGRKVLRNKP